jgi:outer membrane protein OmpA-like peptidoglycan-associated protein
VKTARILSSLASLAMALASAGCGATPMRVASLDELERVHANEEVRSVAAQAPEIFARAEHEREAARAAHAQNDDVGANLHAERAMAAYQHALVARRISAAIADLADSQKAVDDASAQEQALATARAKMEVDAQDLQHQAQTARDRLSLRRGETGSDRQGRWDGARSLAFEARLLCGAARLVGAAPLAGVDASSLADADKVVDAIDAKLAALARPADDAPTEGAADARARCLDVLTRARRTSGRREDSADALLAELSASGGWDPTRDERGVVVVLRGGFVGAKLTDDGASKLEKLGRIAGAHPNGGVQVVVHDAQAAGPKDDGDAQRADAVAKALVAGGAVPARIKTERAGTRAPLVDPTDARLRARNERVEVVFVAGG